IRAARRTVNQFRNAAGATTKLAQSQSPRAHGQSTVSFRHNFILLLRVAINSQPADQPLKDRPQGPGTSDVTAGIVLLAKWFCAHYAFDTANDQLLEFLRSRKFLVTGGEITGIMSHGRQPSLAAVIILAPSDRMEIAVAGVSSDHRLVLGDKPLRDDIGAQPAGTAGGPTRLAIALLINRRQETDMRGEGDEVVPLVGEGPARWQPV